MSAIGNIVSKVVGGIGEALGGAAKMASSALSLDFKGMADGAKEVFNASPVVKAASSLMDGASGDETGAKKDAAAMAGAKASAAAAAAAASANTGMPV